MKTLRRQFPVEVRTLDARTGLVEYVASDQSLDSYREVIRADGWRFDRFSKNAPFVNSHNYDSIDQLLGSVRDFKIANNALVETVQWAIDVPENQLAQLGWKMTQAGHLKAVSVGFLPVKVLTANSDAKSFQAQVDALGLPGDRAPRAIYVEQQQVELSSVIVPANPNALMTFARAYKAGVIDDADLALISTEVTKREHAPPADDPADADRALQRARLAFLVELHTKIRSL